MARRSRRSDPQYVDDFRHADAKRLNNPPAGVAPTYEVRERQTRSYAYDPHLDPQLIWSGKAQIDPTAFEQLRGTVSFPFEAGEHRRIAVKVIDFRGNEVIRVSPLEKVIYMQGRRLTG